MLFGRYLAKDHSYDLSGCTTKPQSTLQRKSLFEKSVIAKNETRRQSKIGKSIVHPSLSITFSKQIVC